MIGHPILGDPRYTYGYMAQRERLLAGSAAQATAAAGTLRQGDDEASQAAPQEEVQSSEAERGSAERELGEASGSEGGLDSPEPGGGGDGNRNGQGGGDRGSGRGVEQPLCLWAVEVQLKHPVSREPMQVQLGEPAVYAALREKHQEEWELHGGPGASRTE